MMREKKIIKEYKSFERDKPDELVQADLTRFNDTNIQWKMIIPESSGLQGCWRMKQMTICSRWYEAHLHNQKDSLLTDNGSSQFNRRNSMKIIL